MTRHIQHDAELEQPVDLSRTWELVLVVAALVLLGAHLGLLGWKLSLAQFPFELMTWTFGSLVLVHAMAVLGWRRALAFFLLTVVLSFAMEATGVATGRIFGRYRYTAVLHPQILGVPYVIPMAYFMVLYPSAMLANLMLRGRVNARLGSWAWSLYAALLSALVMTGWDLVMDPVMVHQVKAWEWLDGGPYFGIPMQNFLGWTLTTFLCSGAYRLLEPHLRAKPLVRGHRGFLTLPLIGFASLLVGTFFVGYPPDTLLIAPFAMGIPLAAGLIRLFQR